MPREQTPPDEVEARLSRNPERQDCVATANTTHIDHDAIIIGAGFAGIYAVHKLRDKLGLDVLAFDAAGDVGGTGYWNRYPGAPAAIESVPYSYSFDAHL